MDLPPNSELQTPNSKTGASTSSLIEALNLKERELISLVGAGGKTTLMFALAKELQALGSRVVTTTTTKIFFPTAEESPSVLLGDAGLFPAMASQLAEKGHVTWAAKHLPGNKLAGVSLQDISALWSSGLTNYLIVEADGSARRPLKAPNEREPVVPSDTTLFITVAGLTALGKPLNETRAFRPEIISRLTGKALNGLIKPGDLVSLIIHPLGGLKGWLPRMRALAFLNQADDGLARERGRAVAKEILGKNNKIERVIVSRLKSLLQEEVPILEIFD
jgi:probable selenium-dependent hydroxylase accessory protein YqeC